MQEKLVSYFPRIREIYEWKEKFVWFGNKNWIKLLKYWLYYIGNLHKFTSRKKHEWEIEFKIFDTAVNCSSNPFYLVLYIFLCICAPLNFPRVFKNPTSAIWVIQALQVKLKFFWIFLSECKVKLHSVWWETFARHCMFTMFLRCKFQSVETANGVWKQNVGTSIVRFILSERYRDHH